MIIEPAAGLLLGDFNVDYKNTSGTGSNTSTIFSGDRSGGGSGGGILMGGQGYAVINELWMFGLEAQLRTLSYSPLLPTELNREYKGVGLVSGINIGLYHSYKWLPKLDLGFYPVDVLSFESAGEDITYAGFGYKAGIKIGSKLQVGAHIYYHDYNMKNDDDLPQVYTTNGATAEETGADATEIVLSLSYPFELDVQLF